MAEYRENQKEIVSLLIEFSCFPNLVGNTKYAASVDAATKTTERYVSHIIQHIFSKAHKRQISNSRFNTEILSLCSELFGNKPMSSIIIDEEAVQSTATENRPRDLI